MEQRPYRFQRQLDAVRDAILAANPGMSSEEAMSLAVEIRDELEWDSDFKHVLLRDDKGAVAKRVRLRA